MNTTDNSETLKTTEDPDIREHEKLMNAVQIFTKHAASISKANYEKNGLLEIH